MVPTTTTRVTSTQANGNKVKDMDREFTHSKMGAILRVFIKKIRGMVKEQ